MNEHCEHVLFSEMARSPQIRKVVAAGDELNLIGAEALAAALQDHGLSSFDHNLESEGCRIELFCSRTSTYTDLVLRVELNRTHHETTLLFLLKSPKQELASVQEMGSRLRADLCQIGRTWYAVINPVPMIDLFEFIVPAGPNCPQWTQGLNQLAA
jgi:hypothetical protein